MAQDNLIEGEIWRPIVGYEGLYEAGNCVAVRSLDRVIECSNKHGTFNKTIKGRILIPCIGKNGYLSVTLSKNGIHETKRLHELIAMTFPEICGEWFPGAEVDHKDGNKLNNKPENLSYKDHKANMNNPITKQRRDEVFQSDEYKKKQAQKMKEVCSRPGEREKRAQSLLDIWKRPEVREKRSNSLKEAWEKPGAREKRSKAQLNRPDKSKQIVQLTMDGEYVAEYPSASEAQRQTGINNCNISACIHGRLKSAGGFLWQFR